MEIKSVTLTNEDLSEIHFKLKGKSIIALPGEKKNEIEIRLDGYSIFLSFILNGTFGEYYIHRKKIDFHACIDGFQPKDSDGIICDTEFSEESYRNLVDLLESKINY